MSQDDSDRQGGRDERLVAAAVNGHNDVWAWRCGMLGLCLIGFGGMVQMGILASMDAKIPEGLGVATGAAVAAIAALLTPARR